MKKHKQALEGVDELQENIESWKNKRAELKKKEVELKCKIDAIDKKNKESQRIMDKLQKSELDSLNHQEKEVSEFIDTFKDTTISPSQGATK